MKGGMTAFRGTGASARAYVEDDRSHADDYYLGEDAAVAAWRLTGADGEDMATADLSPEQYAGWVDWTHPVTGEVMGVPRRTSTGAGVDRKGSPRFFDLIVNAPKSLSVAATLRSLPPSEALARVQATRAAEARRVEQAKAARDAARQRASRLNARGRTSPAVTRVVAGQDAGSDPRTNEHAAARLDGAGTLVPW